MLKSFSLVIFFLVFPSGTVLSAIVCNYTASDGSKYDLSPLSHLGVFNIKTNDHSYLVKVCQNLDEPCFGLSQSVCRIAIPWVPIEFACGDVFAMRFKDYPGKTNSGVTIFYDGGEPCPRVNRTSTLIITCDHYVEGNLISVTEVTGCDLHFEMKSRYACPLPIP